MAVKHRADGDNQGSQGSRLWRAPYVGIATLVAMLLSIGLAHALMRAIEESLGHDLTYVVQLCMRGLRDCIVRWRVLNSLRTNLALDALEQAIGAHKSELGLGMIDHSDRGAQCLANREAERLRNVGISLT